MKIVALHISPNHMYFGKHGQAPGHSPMLAVHNIRCLAGRGIEGDRFLDYKPDYKGQITFFESEIHDQLATNLGLHPLSYAASRRNVITSGVDLNSLIGQEFEIQGLRFLATEECRPCYWMDTAYHAGAEKILKGHGGLRAKILTDGFLHKDDTQQTHPPTEISKQPSHVIPSTPATRLMAT